MSYGCATSCRSSRSRSQGTLRFALLNGRLTFSAASASSSVACSTAYLVVGSDSNTSRPFRTLTAITSAWFRISSMRNRSLREESFTTAPSRPRPAAREPSATHAGSPDRHCGPRPCEGRYEGRLRPRERPGGATRATGRHRSGRSPPVVERSQRPKPSGRRTDELNGGFPDDVASRFRGSRGRFPKLPVGCSERCRVSTCTAGKAPDCATAGPAKCRCNGNSELSAPFVRP